MILIKNQLFNVNIIIYIYFQISIILPVINRYLTFRNISLLTKTLKYGLIIYYQYITDLIVIDKLITSYTMYNIISICHTRYRYSITSKTGIIYRWLFFNLISQPLIFTETIIMLDQFFKDIFCSFYKRNRFIKKRQNKTAIK